MIFGNEQSKTAQPSVPKTGVILVAGATGGVGKRVVRKLQERQYQVRVLVRSIARAKNILGDNVDFYEGDITIPESLRSELMQDVQAVICCTGTRVEPAEGDTPDRQKYYQGVKFYQPAIAQSTPEAVEYQGVKNLVNLAAQYLPKNQEMMIFDFTNPTGELKSVWGAVDDVVMGGVSQSNINLFGRAAVFSGNISTANSGGFASVRNRNFSPALDLSRYEGFELRVKGDGKRYKFIARCEGKWDGISYCYSFDTLDYHWTTIRIPFNQLIPVFRAKTLDNADSFDASRTYAIQLMCSKFEYDGELNPSFKPGYFELQVESIKAYNNQPNSQFIMVSSAGVTRPGRPGLNLAEEPPAVRMNDMLGGILTWKLRGEETVRASNLVYTIVRPCALAEQAGGKTLDFAQGDNIKGQVSREDIAELCVQAINLPEARKKTFEVREYNSQTAKQDWQNWFAKLDRD